ncbi:hypothetical protein ACOXXX_20105 [Thalassococcus sp. BH17M4-6]|uniref:hypothetical protein n=1 Tax=Thalassococcus sp. BH17M4-6 TaxID=3413148 RepID=UPI003BDDBFD4
MDDREPWPDILTLRYRLAPAVVARASQMLTKGLAKQSGSRKFGWLTWVCGWVVIFLASLAYFRLRPDLAYDLPVFPLLATFLFGLFTSLVVVMLHQRRLCRHLAELSAAEGDSTLQIGAERLREQTRLSAREADLSLARPVVELPDVTLIPLGTFGIIVPDSALPEGRSRAAFIAEVSDRVARRKAAA